MDTDVRRDECASGVVGEGRSGVVGSFSLFSSSPSCTVAVDYLSVTVLRRDVEADDDDEADSDDLRAGDTIAAGDCGMMRKVTETTQRCLPIDAT